MRRNAFTALVIIISILMIGCVSQQPAVPSVETLPNITLPEAVDLTFNPLEFTQMAEEKSKANWALVKSIPFGAVENKPVTLNLYKEADNNDFLRAQIDYRKHKYTLLGDISTSVLEASVSNLNNGLTQQASYLLQHPFNGEEREYFLLGGIELYGNGPGLVTYLVYDSKQDKWLQFEKWGIPYLDDVDSDQNKELIIQFPGLHMQFPDVHIIRWQNEQLEESESFQTALGIEAYQPSNVYFLAGNQKYFSVNVNAPDKFNLVILAQGVYRYDNGKLIKVKE